MTEKLIRNENEAIDVLKKNKPTSGYYMLQESVEMAIQALEEIQQYRAYKEIFESHFSKDALELLSDKEEFGKWLERGKWIAKKCDEINRKLESFESIGTVEELKALKDIDEDLRLKYCYEDLSNAEHRGYCQGSNEAVDNFAKFLHDKAKENNGLRLSSETRSWTHPSIFDYLEEFKNEQICKEEVDCESEE